MNTKSREIAVLQRIERGYLKAGELEKIYALKATDLFPEMEKSMSPMEKEIFNARLKKFLEDKNG